jgi:CubicO group peptidase (beta-lactamase class C family)
VQVDVSDETPLAGAYGMAHRGLQVPNRLDTRFQIASGTKGFTALMIASLIEQGLLTLDTTARSLLGEDLPLIDDAVTIEHLLAHRSGIGDYGVGDGGIVSTSEDLHAFWKGLFAGRIVALDLVAQFTDVRTEKASEARSYGRGFWLERGSPAVILEGYDAGVSFRGRHDPSSGITATVMSNTTDGAWPIARDLEQALRRHE